MASRSQRQDQLGRTMLISLINPGQFDEFFRKLGKIKGDSNQLRGTLSEYLAADIARKTLAPEIVMNRIFKVAGRG